MAWPLVESALPSASVTLMVIGWLLSVAVGRVARVDRVDCVCALQQQQHNAGEQRNNFVSWQRA
jgi:hypothetical protein